MSVTGEREDFNNVEIHVGFKYIVSCWRRMQISLISIDEFVQNSELALFEISNSLLCVCVGVPDCYILVHVKV